MYGSSIHAYVCMHACMLLCIRTYVCMHTKTSANGREREAAKNVFWACKKTCFGMVGVERWVWNVYT